MKIEKFEKKIWSGDMVHRELQTEFDLDPHSGFRETWVYTDGRTDDGRLCYDSSSADKIKQS